MTNHCSQCCPMRRPEKAPSRLTRYWAMAEKEIITVLSATAVYFALRFFGV